MDAGHTVEISTRCSAQRTSRSTCSNPAATPCIRVDVHIESAVGGVCDFWDKIRLEPPKEKKEESAAEHTMDGLALPTKIAWQSVALGKHYAVLMADGGAVWGVGCGGSGQLGFPVYAMANHQSQLAKYLSPPASRPIVKPVIPCTNPTPSCLSSTRSPKTLRTTKAWNARARSPPYCDSLWNTSISTQKSPRLPAVTTTLSSCQNRERSYRADYTHGEGWAWAARSQPT